MALNTKIEELKNKREQIARGGGEKAIEKQIAMGKMTARDRVRCMVDENSFQEYDMFVQHDARDFDMD